jgi:pyruvate/2-oxoglutarate dehydrogenase complex dihydrolipoamide dehydrogenase (E3) component
VNIIEGEAKFKSKHEITVAEKTYFADKFIIASGSSPSIPSIEGVENIDYLTNENVFLQDSIPSSLIVIGTGAIGIEMATAFSRLGSKVTLLSRSTGILKQNDEELSKILLEQLKKEGIIFINNANFVKVEQNDAEISLHVNDKIIKSQKILFATGRTANIDLNLENANVAYTKSGIQVNEYLQTSNPNIYAIGDVSTKYKFTHIAEQNAIIAASNISLPIKKKVSYEHIGWCIYSEPELAQVGLTEKEAKQKYANEVKVYKSEYKNTDRGYTDVQKVGMIKISVLNNGKIVGASILGNRAGELIHQIQFAKTFNMSFDKLSKMVYIYPTFADIIKQPSKQFYIQKLYNNPLLKFAKFLKSMVLGK